MPITNPRAECPWRTLALGLLVCLAGCAEPGLPEPGSLAYEGTVEAYYKGLAAIASGTDLGAEDLLLDAARLAPEEPAIWANLGLLALRQNDLPTARERLERARLYAPNNPDVQFLLGQTARIEGDTGAALQSFQAAASADSAHLRSRFALAQLYTEQGTPAEAARHLDTLRTLVPANVAVLVERARLAAQMQDAPALQDALESLDALSAAWPGVAQTQRQLAAEASTPDAVENALLVLRNVLLRVPAFRADLRTVQPPTEEVAALIPGFLRLPEPHLQPAPADTLLHFTPQPLTGGPVEGMYALLLNGNLLPNVTVLRGGQWMALSDTLNLPTTLGAGPLIGVDLDNDFRTDLVAIGEGGPRIFRQDSSGTFTPLPLALAQANFTHAWVADLDLEGDLDLILAAPGRATQVLRNNGDLTFTPLPLLDAYRGLTHFTWADFDGDGDPDAALRDETGTLHLLRNQRNGTFTPQPLADAGGVEALTVADLNRDATLDLISVDDQGRVRRWVAAASGSWATTQLFRYTPTSPVRELIVGDFDNNAADDLLLASAGEGHLWLGQEDGFAPSPLRIPAHIDHVGDLNGDGRLDVVGRQGLQPVQLTNTGTTSYAWQIFRPRAARAIGDQRINSFGLGGEIEIRAGLQYQKKTVTGPVVHFGLGRQPAVGLTRIIWPNGSIQAEFDLPASQALIARQRLKGSCPWVFTYDGQGLTFVTDFLWRSPLGLRINALETAGIMTTEDWVKIRGDQLAPRDGQYDIRITAELWETHFFDQVALMVVDHPADTEIWVDERFAFPPPAPKIHTTGPLQPIRGARDDAGRDVTDALRKRDGQYLATAGLGRYQGITRPHTLEIDLGPDATQAPRKWLLASGWVYPTDSSINVALSQGNHPRPEGLSLDVQDAEGRWHEVQTGIGFPSGKRKTILIDVSAAVTVGETQRIRLKTNLEIYWDALHWAVPFEATAVEVQRLQPAQAALRYRGYSQTRIPGRTHPELPIYDTLAATTQVWRDLEGYHTRYGDVRELLAGIDDRYVIMNAGDELRFAFTAPPPPKAGWQRDYVLIGDGWVKDGDYNTGFSRTVLPLPSHAETAYKHPPSTLEADPVFQKHRLDWERFHTRYVSPARFHTALVPSGLDTRGR